MNALLAVLLLLSAMPAHAAAAAELACVDAPLTVPLARPVGPITVEREDGVLLQRIDPSLVADTAPSNANLPTRLLGGGIGSSHSPVRYFPLLGDGTHTSIYLDQPLAYGQTYRVLADGQQWTFTTRTTPPDVTARQLTVAADASGDFCTIQGAVDAVPDDPSGPPWQITIQPGTYTELVYINPQKPPLMIVGADRDTTVIQYANNNTLNPTSRTRAVFGADAADFSLAHLTIRNLTPNGCGNQGQPCAQGGQAEALRGEAERIVLSDVRLLSFQDTLQLGSSVRSSAYVEGAYIEGNVDFTWGYGRTFFHNCELKTLPRAGAPGAASSPAYIAQIRNNAEVSGNVYVGCTLSRASGVEDATTYLARIDPRDGPGFPFSQVVFIDTAMDAHIKPEGWLLNNVEGEPPDTSFAEFNSSNLDGTPLSLDGRAPFAHQLTPDEAAALRDPAAVLGWDPAPRVAALP